MPSTRRAPSCPTDLDARGAGFWRQTVKVFDLSDAEQQLLRECCRLLDECESLRQALDADGTTVRGSTGQVRVHPAIAELRQHRIAVGRLLAQLDLPDAEDSSILTPAQARGKKAAQTRWATRNRLVAANG